MNNYIDSVKHKGKFYKYKDWDLIHPGEENVGKILSVSLDENGNPVSTWVENNSNADTEDILNKIKHLFQEHTVNKYKYKYVGTPIPNTGSINGIYVRPGFKFEDVLEYFSDITFHDIPDGSKMYSIIALADKNVNNSFFSLIQIPESNFKGVVAGGELAFVTDGVNSQTTEIGAEMLSFLSSNNWYYEMPLNISNKANINYEMSPDPTDVGHIEIISGDQNDKISSLISLTPIVEEIDETIVNNCIKYAIADKEGNDIVDTYQTKKDANKILEFTLNSIENGVLINRDTFDALKNRDFKYILATEEENSNKAQCYFSLESYFRTKDDDAGLDMEALLFSTRELEILDRKHTTSEIIVMFSNNDNLGAIMYSGKTELMIVDALRIVMSDGRELTKRFDGNNYYYEFPDAGDNLNSDIYAYPTAKQVKNYIENNKNNEAFTLYYSQLEQSPSGYHITDEIHQKIIDRKITSVILEMNMFETPVKITLNRTSDVQQTETGSMSARGIIYFSGLSDSMQSMLVHGTYCVVTVVYDTLSHCFKIIADSDHQDLHTRILSESLKIKANNLKEIGEMTWNDGEAISLNVETTANLSNDDHLVNSKIVKSYVSSKIPTKTSQLTNDSNFITEHQDISGKLDSTTAEQTYLKQSDAELVYETKEAADQRISNLVGAAPDTLDTIGELATALKNNKDIVDVINESIVKKANSSDLATVATTGEYNDLKNKPELSKVATSGSYNDLLDLPDSSSSQGSVNIIEHKTEGFIPATLDEINYETSKIFLNTNHSREEYIEMFSKLNYQEFDGKLVYPMMSIEDPENQNTISQFDLFVLKISDTHYQVGKMNFDFDYDTEEYDEENNIAIRKIIYHFHKLYDTEEDYWRIWEFGLSEVEPGYFYYGSISLDRNSGDYYGYYGNCFYPLENYYIDYGKIVYNYNNGQYDLEHEKTELITFSFNENCTPFSQNDKLGNLISFGIPKPIINGIVQAVEQDENGINVHYRKFIEEFSTEPPVGHNLTQHGNNYRTTANFFRTYNNSTVYIEEWLNGSLVGTSPFVVGGLRKEGWSVVFKDFASLHSIGNEGSSSTCNWFPIESDPRSAEGMTPCSTYYNNYYFNIYNNKIWVANDYGDCYELTDFSSNLTILNDENGDPDPLVYKSSGDYLVIRRYSSPLNINKVISDRDGDYKLIPISEYYAILRSISNLSESQSKFITEDYIENLSIVEANPSVETNTPELMSVAINGTNYKIGIAEDKVNEMIENYIAAHFENGDEGSY